MKKLILLLILALCPVYSWAACTGTNYGDVSMTNLPEKILGQCRELYRRDGTV